MRFVRDRLSVINVWLGMCSIWRVLLVVGLTRDIIRVIRNVSVMLGSGILVDHVEYALKD